MNVQDTVCAEERLVYSGNGTCSGVGIKTSVECVRPWVSAGSEYMAHTTCKGKVTLNTGPEPY